MCHLNICMLVPYITKQDIIQKFNRDVELSYYMYIEIALQFLTHKDLILIQAATMAMLYNPACCCLINGTVHIPPMKENYQPPEHLKDFISVSLKEYYGS